MAVNLPEQIVPLVWDVSYKGAALGFTGEVKPTNKLKTLPITAAQTYGQEIGRRVLGVDVMVEATLKEWIKENFAIAFPWWSGSGSIPMCPAALGSDLYDYAGALIAHPRHMGADVSRDWNMLKAVCVGGIELPGDGNKETTFKLQFALFPDRAQFPSIVLGTAAT